LDILNFRVKIQQKIEGFRNQDGNLRNRHGKIQPETPDQKTTASMNRLNAKIFITLFREVCQKCFGFPLITPLSETDSRLLSTTILEKTGLVIGARSIKNYSIYIVKGKGSSKENPSAATLDTMARYVLDAPYTTEIQRKNRESHFPYWFQYRSRFSSTGTTSPMRDINLKMTLFLFAIALLATAGYFTVKFLAVKNKSGVFSDTFHSVGEDSLKSKGWIIKSKDPVWWNRRMVKPGHLTLFTLKGDNFKNDENNAGIHNLLMRKISSDCFMAEIHLTNFIPRKNWQQAGILLAEDSTFRGKVLRLSLSYNDFFGGYKKPAEIIIQVVSSSESSDFSKPEEIAHIPLFSLDPDPEGLVRNNLNISALKIEKKGEQFRFLYTSGSRESFAFKEAASGKFDINPRFIGLFAIQGWADQEDAMEVYFDSFAFAPISCNP
jgi:hypothetical protein